MKFSESPLLPLRLSVGRARFVLILLLAAFVAMLVRALMLQGLDDERLRLRGEARKSGMERIAAHRGRIVDRHGTLLAASTPARAIGAYPEEARLTPAQLRDLAASLAMPVSDVSRRLAEDSRFVLLKRQVAPKVADELLALKLPGLKSDVEYRRYYPAADVAAHVVGFTDVDDRGQEGVELSFEKSLSGQPGSTRVLRDGRRRIVEHIEHLRSPRDGEDVQLALDGKLQFLAYSHLRQAVEDNRARAGAVVVLDVDTGEILALANLPSYNPNDRQGLSGEQLRNRALTDTFEPGSTLKPMTIALALETGRVRPDTPIQTAPGRLTIGNATISDAHPHGLLSVAEVIQKSSNVGAAKIAEKLSPEEMWSMFVALGFGSPPGLGFPGEAGGRVRPFARWRPIEQATMSYGHGIAVSLTQLAHAYLVFARDGDLLPLSLLRRDAGPVTGRQVFSPATARAVRAMLEMAVLPGGTAPKAQIPGFRVAGKTGTAHKLENGVYARRYVSSFVGFAPVSRPRLIVAVMIDEPSAGKHYGGDVAAPVFARIMEDSLRARGVVPDAPVKPPVQLVTTRASGGRL